MYPQAGDSLTAYFTRTAFVVGHETWKTTRQYSKLQAGRSTYTLGTQVYCAQVLYVTHAVSEACATRGGGLETVTALSLEYKLHLEGSQCPLSKSTDCPILENPAQFVPSS
jgi:hypothetical protein